MQNPNILPSNRAVLAGVIYPQTALPVGGALTTGWVSLSDYGSILATVFAGSIVATGGITAKLEQATDSGGSGVKDVTGKAITAYGGADDNKEVAINCRSSELDVANSFTHVRLSISVTDSASPDTAIPVAGSIHGFDARYQPATAVTSLKEVVS